MYRNIAGIIIKILLIFFCLFLIIKNTSFNCGKQKNVEKKAVRVVKVVNDSLTHPEEDSLFILLDALKTDSVLKHASLAYVFYNLTQDSIISEYNPYLSLVPASTMKILTSAAALEILGPDTRFKTTLCYDGKIKNKILNGNIYINGGGDPALGSTIYDQSGFVDTFIKAIQDLNLDTINGNIIADPRIFSIDAIPYSWSYGEINEAYAAAANGLTVYDNTYLYEISKNDKGFVKPDAVNIIPKIPSISFYNSFVITDDEKESLFILNQPGSFRKIIKGSFPKALSKITLKGAIPDPPYLIAFEMFEKLLLKGIYIKGSPMTIYDVEAKEAENKKNSDMKQIAVIYSPTVFSIVENVNMHSNNLFAEHLLKHIGLKKYGIGDTESGANAIVNFWKQKGVDVEGLYMFDGCGLSRYNAITAKQLTDVLVYMKSSANFSDFYNSLSKAGETGTLRKLCIGSNAEGQISAKSGTMSRVKSYAGYACTLKNDTIVFSIIANNFICPASEMTKKFEQIMIKTVELK